MIASPSIPRLERSHLGLRLLALFLSIFLWAFVRFTQTPFSATISQADVQVPLEVMTDESMAALEAPSTVGITVRGSEDAIRGLKPNAIAATIDLRDSAEGLLFPRVTVTPPPELSVVNVDPERLSIRLVPVISQRFPVEAKLSGHVAQGYSASVPVLRTGTVDVKGPKPYVQQVRAVNAVVLLNNTETGLMQRVLLEPRDEDGNLVRNVEVSPESEIVTVNVTPAVVPRIIPVFPAFSGALPSETSMSTSWTPRLLPLVSARGGTAPPPALYTAPIDLTRLGPGVHRFTLPVAAPADTTLVKEREVRVVVKVQTAQQAGTPDGAKVPPDPQPR